jgi:hydrogenase nickel incorporation protein HypA/HybF
VVRVVRAGWRQGDREPVRTPSWVGQWPAENMHEMGIANSVLQAVRIEMGRHPGTYPCKVGVRIGELAAIDQDSLRFCFEAMIQDTDLDSLTLGIEICPRRHRCRICAHEFVVRDYDSCCAQCGSPETTCIAGDELELAYLEVEEYGPNSVGAKGTQ